MSSSSSSSSSGPNGFTYCAAEVKCAVCKVVMRPESLRIRVLTSEICCSSCSAKAFPSGIYVVPPVACLPHSLIQVLEAAEVKCDRCEKKMTYSQFQGIHQKGNCFRKCPLCMWHISVDYEKDNTHSLECEGVQVECETAQYTKECQWKGRRKDRAAHHMECKVYPALPVLKKYSEKFKEHPMVLVVGNKYYFQTNASGFARFAEKQLCTLVSNSDARRKYTVKTQQDLKYELPHDQTNVTIFKATDINQERERSYNKKDTSDSDSEDSDDSDSDSSVPATPPRSPVY